MTITTITLIVSSRVMVKILFCNKIEYKFMAYTYSWFLLVAYLNQKFGKIFYYLLERDPNFMEVRVKIAREAVENASFEQFLDSPDY